MGDDLVSYVRGQLDHDLLVAQIALEQDSVWWWDDPDCDSPAEQHIAVWRPEHTLRVITAQRAILDLHQNCPQPCAEIRAIAEVYHQRQDFEPEWLVDPTAPKFRCASTPATKRRTARAGAHVARRIG